MSTALETDLAPMDIRSLHERMGRVYHQPVRVHSFTNKRFTVNFRVPLEQLRRIVPEAIQLDEIRDTGLGVLGMCACDFWVSRFGWLPIPPVRNNDMLCRVSAKICKGGKAYRAYYTLRSDSSSRFLGFALGHVLLPQIQLSISADRLPARDVRPAGGVGLRDVHAKHEADLGNLVALS
jgi:hypothetical protein